MVQHDETKCKHRRLTVHHLARFYVYSHSRINALNDGRHEQNKKVATVATEVRTEMRACCII